MQKDNKDKIGFFQTILGICSGTEIFSKLTKTAPIRAIFHFIILALIATSTYTAIKAPQVLKSAVTYCTAFDKYFGGIKFSKDGLTPLSSPEKSRTIKIKNLKIDYIPSPDINAEIRNDGAKNGIIWLPKALYFWINSESGYQYVPILSSSKNINTSKLNTASLNTILDIAKKDNFEPAAYNISQSLSFSDMKPVIFLTTLALYFIGMFFNMFISIPLYSLMLLAIFSLFGNRILEKIKTANFFSIILYSSFPGIIIATLYTALSLPLFDFKTLAFTSLIIYAVLTVNSLQKKLFSHKQEDQDYDDDIF